MAFKKTTNKETNNTINYEVLEECGTVSTQKEWELKLRYVSWNEKEPKYDLRMWKVDENGEERCKKGNTFSGEELENLLKILKRMESEE